MPSPNAPLAVLTHEFYPYRGGIAVYIEETARAAAANRKVTVWAPDKPELRAQTWPFIVKPVEMRGTLGWRCRIALARAIHQAREELAQSIVWLAEPGALLTAMYLNAPGRMPAKKIVLTLHGSEILRFAAWPHRRRLFQKLLDRAERVGVVSQFTQNLLADNFKVTAEKMVMVSGALRSDYAKKLPPRLEKPAGTPVVLLTVARIHPRKGQHCVLEALAQLPEEIKARLEYRIAGPVVKEDYQKQLEALAKNAGVKVRFLGEVADADLTAIYADADIFVMTPEQHGPSVEGFGLVYLEAAAAGLPVVAHRTGGVGEAVRDGVTGILVEPSDRAGLTKAIETLVKDGTQRSRLAIAGAQRIRELSWEKNVAALFSL